MWSCDGVLCRCVAGGGSAHGTRARTRADARYLAVLTIHCSVVVAGRRRCVSMAIARYCATSLLMLIDHMGCAVLLELAHLEWIGLHVYDVATYFSIFGCRRIPLLRGLHALAALSITGGVVASVVVAQWMLASVTATLLLQTLRVWLLLLLKHRAHDSWRMSRERTSQAQWLAGQ